MTTRKTKTKTTEDVVLDDIETVLPALRAKATKRVLGRMARSRIPSERALGVSVSDIRSVAKRVGRNHALADALWRSGLYEARMMCAYVDEPERITAAQMERWCRDFDSWALCDTLCFHLFDKSPHAFEKVAEWAGDDDEFVKRAAFALLASLAGHDEGSGDDAFLACLPLIERAAVDERGFVKKGVSWALRGIGRRNRRLRAAAVVVAKRLSTSNKAASRWVGVDALRDLARRPPARSAMASAR